ncbi:MAG: type II toxin-antitoxin system RelE/ParE family toxin [Microcoleus sp. PH2017_25_DOB_D_A]|nr:type II toxin-antitoxin system RelE/ParE family toxin [Microcoleus sp. PH2017_13_LAR_U_A]MCC3487121.1 type II toxin-antitoxin system RelE/ParE family toxin [Microcoleus sp. PH2017_14_LAR_D_A]MCC3492790.1 type II toxin-antitoxin system RelE/ParE family toxin [Microcoleus sp. PH2017_16_JOR_D_A]MCC3499017.1 type II toxin-antitoxin system RelE/ParE family toxin [Microcoleus sp. PH2017_15_JOR_U_A]MCC3536823.1 type II toxin-antitoxin system RelE/ParE family toxin [Microcoleus sp. PH2017_25_DOB_D_A
MSDSLMNYQVEFKPKAVKDLASLPAEVQHRVLTKIELMQNNLAGDVKRLTNYTPEYRLRVGDYRVLFEIEGDVLVIYRVKHRKDAYS